MHNHFEHKCKAYHVSALCFIICQNLLANIICHFCCTVVSVCKHVQLNQELVLLLPKSLSVCPLFNLIQSTTLDSMLELDKVRVLQCG